ncbi:MAG: UDP-N-acetylmuramate--L-alanine ligase [Bacteroidales bacterium]|nr:UDP-N-acetylmuramate--L-alanine ligase [Bacteroidales bacterium]
MNLKQIHKIYFLGIGGIGMSALARYFASEGKKTAGYDRTCTPLTEELSQSGIKIHYEDDIKLIPAGFLNPHDTLVIRTPAIPEDHNEFTYFRQNKFNIHKRAEVLGLISRDKKALCVAGTHGKTTISSMVAWLMHNSDFGCNAFLGGISKNFNSNFVKSPSSEFVVVEADEFDRSFLFLRPEIAVITATDADHLDIYGSHDEVVKSFEAFTELIQCDGKLLVKQGLGLKVQNADIGVFTYALHGDADYYAENIRLEQGKYHFDVVTPVEIIKNLSVSHPGIVNVENAVAAVAVAILAGVSRHSIKESLPLFKGIKRRFDIIFQSDKAVYIDDYAHHPKEIEATIHSVKQLFPGKKVTAVFQPHLYSRTRDLASGFAESLDKVDDVILLDIYPARELPIENVDSGIILSKIKHADKILITKEQLLDTLGKKDLEVLVTLGAGDIDNYTGVIRQMFINRYGIDT